MPKKLLLAMLLIAGTCFTALAQDISYKSVSNHDLNYVLNNLQKRYVYTDHKTLSIAVYLVNDPPLNYGTTTSSIYIAVSETGTNPDQRLYRLSSVSNPKFKNWIKSSKMYKVAFSYGLGKKQTATVGITLKKLVIE